MKTERLWPPAVLRLAWKGLRGAWAVMIASWAVLIAISVVAYHQWRPIEPTLSFYGQFLMRTVGQIAVTAVVTAWLVATLIQKMQPEALNGASPLRLIPWGWGGSFAANVLVQTPGMLGVAVIGWIVGTGNLALVSTVYPVQGLATLVATVLFAFALSEALTRRVGPLAALGGSVRLTRGNRFAVLVVMILLSLARTGVTAALYALMPTQGMTNGQLVQVTAVQSVVGVLSAVVLTAVYLELRRIQRVGAPEAISKAFD